MGFFIHLECNSVNIYQSEIWIGQKLWRKMKTHLWPVPFSISVLIFCITKRGRKGTRMVMCFSYLLLLLPPPPPYLFHTLSLTHSLRQYIINSAVSFAAVVSICHSRCVSELNKHQGSEVWKNAFEKYSVIVWQHRVKCPVTQREKSNTWVSNVWEAHKLLHCISMLVMFSFSVKYI
jgi:hypothetical protein